MPANPDRTGAHRAESLPVDSDLDDTAAGQDPPSSGRQVHQSGRYLALVGLGGAAGTSARYLITEAAGQRGTDSATATLMINMAGCLLIGVLLELLARLGPDHGRRRVLRLLLGTGVLGGFTTYSTLAEVVAASVDAHRLLAALGYGLLSLAAGLGACAIGVLLGTRILRESRPGVRR